MSFVTTALRLSAGVIVWSLHFAVIYGFTALACARGMAAPVPWIIGVATLAGGGACVAIMVAALGRREQFESWVAAGVAGFALLAILWESIPVLTVAPCQ